MKRTSLIIAGIIFLVTSGIFLGAFFSEKEGEVVKNVSNNHDKKEITITAKEEPIQVQIASNKDPLGTMPAYKEDGEQCKNIEAIKERGDCFQKVHAYYSLWTLNTSKDEFYFPFQHHQSDWKDIFYVGINASDQLDDLQPTEHSDEYIDAYATGEEAYERGVDLLHDYWYVFSSMIPQEERGMLTEMAWTDTGEDYVFAVDISQEDIESLQLVISDNVFDYWSSLKWTFVHEFAHMLTLHAAQVSIDEQLLLSEEEEDWVQAEEDCPTLFAALRTSILENLYDLNVGDGAYY